MSEKKIRIGDLDSRTMLYTEFRASGGDPSFLFELLEGIIARREWEELKGEDGKPVGSFRRLIEAPMPTGCGQPAAKLLNLLAIEHHHARNDNDYAQRMKKLRDEVSGLLDKEESQKIPNGGDRKSQAFQNQIEAPQLKATSRSREDNLRRLKRDNPDLADKVMRGKLTAHKAAQMMGWEQPKIRVYPDKPQQTAKQLRAALDDNQLAELLAILASMIAEEPQS